MKNYKLSYIYDGYRFWDVIRAESMEDAKEWFEHEDSDRKVYGITETDEFPSHTVTEAELEKIRNPIPLWKTRGAESEEEFIEYIKYCQETDQKVFAEYSVAHPDVDPEDYPDETMTIEEWRKSKIK